MKNPIPENVYPAHIRIDKDGKIVVQTVKVHCENAAAIAAEALKAVGLEHVAQIAALTHDGGKCKIKYKKSIETRALTGSSQGVYRPKHTYTAVGLIMERYHRPITRANHDKQGIRNLTAEIIAYAATAHHSVLDLINEYRRSEFLTRIQNDPDYEEARENFLMQCAGYNELDRLFDKAVTEVKALINRLFAMTPKTQDGLVEANYYVGMIARLILSAVVEGDRRDTAAFMNPQSLKSNTSDEIETDDVFWAAQLAHAKKQMRAMPASTRLEKARKYGAVLTSEAGSRPEGVYRLQLPADTETTLSTILFALGNAKSQEKQRIIFATPLLSALDQVAENLELCLKNPKSVMIAHASDLVRTNPDLLDLDQHELLAENWDKPIIATTLVQLLNALYASDMVAVRRFHALCNSVIIIDQVQTIPIKLKSLINLAINYLVEAMNCTVLLVSQAQSVAMIVPHPIRVATNQVIATENPIYKVFERTHIQKLDVSYYTNEKKSGIETIPDVARKILDNEAKSLVIVCNTIQQVDTLYKKLKDDKDKRVLTLTGKMCKAHRDATIAAIEAELYANRRGHSKTICIASPIIEHGTNLSFEAAIRFSSGLDHIIQTAGLCNRNYEYGISTVYVFQCNRENLSSLPEIQRGKDIVENLLANADKIPLNSQEAIDRYYRYTGQELGIGNQDYTIHRKGRSISILSLLSTNSYYYGDCDGARGKFQLNQAFKLAGTLFDAFGRSNTAGTLDVIAPYGEGKALIEKLSGLDINNNYNDCIEILRALKPYTVSVTDAQHKELVAAGAMTPLLDGALWALNDNWYDPAFGLDRNGTKHVSSAKKSPTKHRIA